MGSPEAGPGRWRATGALAGEGGIILPCLDAQDYFRACVTWLCMLEAAFSEKLKGGFNLTPYPINTSQTFKLPTSGHLYFPYV